jgi:phospholipid/cholesterol/gamma-HCH transport system substrate-binding protein
MKKTLTKEAKIGITTIISLVLLYIGINFLKGIDLFNPSNYYYVVCTNVRDITISSPVFVEGFKVGLVRSVKYDYSTVDRITVEISLDKEMKVNRGSYVSIESSLLSGAQLNIKLNKHASEYFVPGDILEGRLQGGMAATVEESIVPYIVNMMPKIDSILSGLQTIVNSQELSRSLDNLEHATGQLEESSIRLNAFLKNDIPEISSNLKATSSNLSTFSNSLNNLELDKSLNYLNSALGNIDEMSLKLNSKDNSLGLLLNDTMLYNNFNRTIENASILLIDIRQNPKKYVKLSLF